MNIDGLYTTFYAVDAMIFKIHENIKINKHLAYCKYNGLNITDEYDLPITMYLGGGGYIQYNHIFKNENLVDSIQLKSRDYDISFSFNTLNYKNNIKDIITEIKNIYVISIEKFKYQNINKNNFKLSHVINPNRLHFRVECKIPNIKEFHILEMSFWFNGKVSDNFTINDFIKTQIYLYKHQNYYYYLLPLELLVKTMLYALIDFFERRNFNKCNKYLERIKFIKSCNKILIDKKSNNNCLTIIFDSYVNKIKRKYKMMNDYPFIMSPYLNDIKNNGVIKCIYKNLRKNNHNKLKEEINKYKLVCKDELSYNPELSMITPDDTDDEI
jgi:hypothetical protein